MDSQCLQPRLLFLRFDPDSEKKQNNMIIYENLSLKRAERQPLEGSRGLNRHTKMQSGVERARIARAYIAQRCNLYELNVGRAS